MNIDGLGDETIDHFYKQGFLTQISDLYSLHQKRDQLKTLERFGEKSIENMLAGIEGSKQMPFEKVLFGLGIRFVGETVAKKLVAHFRTIDMLINASLEELVAVDEIGERIAESVQRYFANPEHIHQLNLLKSYGLQFESEFKEVVLAGTQLEGKSFIISGVFENHSREELKELIESYGGKILSSISVKLSYVVAGANMGPAKLEKAQKLGIPIISDEDLLAMLA
jgi:DNA ligase (NAD+)